MYDIHAVAGLLKLFLRELTEPILTFELQPKFLQIPGNYFKPYRS